MHKECMSVSRTNMAVLEFYFINNDVMSVMFVLNDELVHY